MEKLWKKVEKFGKSAIFSKLRFYTMKQLLTLDVESNLRADKIQA